MPPSVHHGRMSLRATTVEFDDELLAAVDAAATRAGTSRDQVIRDAVRARFATDEVVRTMWARIGEGDLSEQESLDLAYSELRAMRAERRAGRAVS